MNESQALAILTKKLKSASVEVLKEGIVELNKRLDDVATVALDLGLQILENKISQDEFIEFCDSLYDSI